jgi:tetratricopeptide (TPR) repeat protein
MAMSASAVEKPTPTPAGRSEVRANSVSPSADTADSLGADRHLHAQDSDRVYQAAGDQYIFDQVLPTPAAVTNTLPRDIAAFTGRDRELDSLITTVNDLVADGRTIPIFVVGGMPGVGKTTFAVHAAHRLSPNFPDGQMFVDMHAHTSGKAPVEPAEALSALLLLDGVRVRDIPDDIDGRSALWRARMAGRRSILILDNVIGHRQVEPLLSGTAGCLVLVTSRRRLTGLGARHAAAMVLLDPLSPGPAADLFIRLTDRAPEEGQTQAVTELVLLCGHLPLAISLMAARIRPEPQWRVQTLVDDLLAARDRLAHMRAEDIQVAAAFNLSYRYLPAARRRFFRCLGMSPGPDIDAYAAAALTGAGLATARRHLDALYEDHLVDQPVQGRYRLHDLLRAFARTLVAGDGTRQQDQALGRLLDYYLHAAVIANQHIAPRPSQVVGANTRFPRAVPVLANAEQAAEWMATELPNLLACAMHAMGRGDETRLIGISTALAPFLRRAGLYRQSIVIHSRAADAAARIGDWAARATALYHVGVLLRRAGNYRAAIEVLAEAFDLYRDLGDRVGEAEVLTVAGIVRRLAGDDLAAAEVLDEALARFRELADPAGEAEVLAELAVIRALADDCATAIHMLDRALVLYRRAGNPQGQAYVLFRLGKVRRLTHEYPAAIQALQHAMTLYRGLGARLGLAHTQFNLGVVCRLTGDYREAAKLLDESLGIYQEVGDRLGQANALKHLGILRRLTGDRGSATQALLESLSHYQRLGNRRSTAETLQELGVVRWLAGDTSQAIDNLTEALTIFQDLGSRSGQAEVLNCLGKTLLDNGDVRALERFHAALRLAREVRNPLEEAHALEGIARCALHQNDTDRAIRQLQAALEINERIGAPDAAPIRVLLTSLAGSS